jgi:Ran GTPase-activating protein (RanGAP) involved in mRNA processing and transport
MTSPLRTLNNALGYIRRNDEIVSELDLSYNVITVHEAKELAELIAHPLCRVPVTLSLRGCGIPDEGTAAIFQGLSINTSITALDLTNLALGHFGVSSLSKTLSENSTLTKINVWGCGLGAHRAKHLFEGLSENRGLKKLDLGNNYFGNIGLQHLEVS